MSAVKTGITILSILILATLLMGCSNSVAPAKQTDTKAPDEKAALDAIAKINSAQATYFKLNRRYALTYDELIEAHLLNSEPTPAQTGYEFRLRPAADAQTYKLSVVPSSSGAGRSFFTDQTAVVRAESGKEATADSPQI